jgi:hypothetical protein
MNDESARRSRRAAMEKTMIRNTLYAFVAALSWLGVATPTLVAIYAGIGAPTGTGIF